MFCIFFIKKLRKGKKATRRLGKQKKLGHKKKLGKVKVLTNEWARLPKVSYE